MAVAAGLKRQLGVGDAIVIGVGSMIGAGVFAAWAPAAEAAGTALLIGLGVAAIVAFCNATSSAQLAAIHPESGGTYVYARRQLGPFWGFLAGWGFVVGKTASCAAMALTVGAYLSPDHARVLAIAAVLMIAAVNLGGLTRTVTITRVLLAVALVTLTGVVVAGWLDSHADVGRIVPFDAGLRDVLQSAGFLFFAFAGYARIATLGEEVRDPSVTIPKAIPRALFLVFFIYAVVGVTVLAVVPVAEVAESAAPLRLVVEAGRFDALGPLVRFGAGFAALGVLLNLIPGVSRSVLAIARRREFPTFLAHIDRTRAVPLRAELCVTAVVVILVATLDLRGAIGFSSVTVLTYYAITNASALTLSADQRRWPRPIAMLGLAGCVALALTLPTAAVIVGAVVLAIGAVIRAATLRLGHDR